MISPAAKPTVLLIEDDMDQADLFRFCLTEYGLGVVVRHVPDGADALAYMRRQGKYSNALLNPRPRLVLLDLRMPKVDGIDVLKQIKSDPQLRSIPVVVFSSSHADPDVRRAYDEGANAFVVKPLDFEQVMQFFRDVVCFWTQWNLLPRAETSEAAVNPTSVV